MKHLLSKAVAETLESNYKKKVKAFCSEVHDSKPVVILGNQKTGSTAIAALLSEATQQSVTLDLKKAIPDVGWQLCIKHNVMKFSDVAYKYRSDFKRSIIKEPCLTFFYDEVRELMPNAKFVFIQRDPFQNIRSILNRLGIPGDLQNINLDDWPELAKTPVWRLVLDSTWLGRDSGSYIEGLAHRWDLAAKECLNGDKEFFVIKYEDFIKDKEGAIYSLADSLGMEIKKNISGNVDVQYQGRGNSAVSVKDFFGMRNCEIIRNICGESADKLGYAI
ncbi:sulfotransferase family protein [Halomonas koreensis]|uniref:Sulfotransferase n=1 Tax=Halomonas koreensis TaxID=245385 RepID=A0ABU1G0F3_9GAMM|nr:sulfotransferase [Halomonas koreensis]MDR5865947.1 sulfotransferase [Halomonas koreensis]